MSDEESGASWQGSSPRFPAQKGHEQREHFGIHTYREMAILTKSGAGPRLRLFATDSTRSPP